MKHFLLLQYCVSVVCIASSTAGYYNHGHPLLINTKTHSQGQPQPHKIHKRQGDPNRDDCDVVVHDEFCTNGYYQDTVNVYQRCNESYTATEIQAFCIPSFMGGYCLHKQYNQLERNVTRVCGSSSSTCSQECRDVLISTRSELGCCIQSAYNDSTVPIFYTPIPYAYSLWSSCGVEPVTQGCPPSTVTLSPTPVDPTCSNNREARLQLVFSAICTLQYRQSVSNRLLLTEGCQNYSASSTEFSYCTINRLGTYCGIVNTTSYNFFIAASDNCHNTSTCGPRCIETLNNITSTMGCCFNDHLMIL